MLIRKKYFKNILTLGSGTAFAQVILLLIYPFLTRFYTTSDFGYFGLFSAIVFLIGDVINGRYDLSIMLPDNNLYAKRLLKLSILLALVISVFVSFLLILTHQTVKYYLQVDGVMLGIYVFPALFQFGIIQAASVYLNRNKKYKAISFIRLTQSVMIGVFSLLFALVGSKEVGLVIGFLTGQLISLLLVLYHLRKEFFSIIRVPYYEMLESAKYYRSFPKFSVLATWLNTGSRQVPFFFIPHYFGMEVLGMLSLAYKILGTPLGIISGSFSQIFYERSNRANLIGKQYLKKISYTTMRFLLVLGLFPLLIITFLGPSLFSLLFGKEWVTAGTYAAWLMPWFYLLMVISPLSYLVNVLNLLRFELNYNIMLFLTRIFVIILGGIYLSAFDTIRIYALTGFLFASFYIYYLFRKIYNVS